jgi:hypothetical protein
MGGCDHIFYGQHFGGAADGIARLSVADSGGSLSEAIGGEQT